MKTPALTLDQIRNVVRAEGKTIVAAFDKDIKFLEGRLSSFEDNVNNRFNEVDKRFDTNDDVHQEILGAIDEMCDRKISKHCREKHSFATS